MIWNPANDGGAITVKPNFYATSKTLPPPPPVPTASSGKQQHSETYTFTAPASPLISPYHSDSSGSGPFSRCLMFRSDLTLMINFRNSTLNKSDRPKVPPPSVPQRPRDSVIQKLYDEHGDEIGVDERIRCAIKIFVFCDFGRLEELIRISPYHQRPSRKTTNSVQQP